MTNTDCLCINPDATKKISFLLLNQHKMLEGISNLSLGAVIGGAVVATLSFLRGYFQHFGTKAASATISQVLPSSDENFSDEELKKRTLELHGEISEFQTRKKRRSSRNFWDQSGEEIDRDAMMEQHKQQSIIREEMRGEFLKKFAPRLEMILQEYEERGIEPDDEMNDLESVRWWAKHAETSRILPTLRNLAQKLEADENY